MSILTASISHVHISNKTAFQLKTDHPHDLDLDPMTSILEFDLDITITHMQTKNEVCRLRLSKLELEQDRNTCTDRCN